MGLFVLYLLAFFAYPGPAKGEYTLEDHHKLLLISFDGIRWDYVDRRPDLESFKFLQENGAHAEYIIPPFPTMTSPAHTTLATGLYVESHGVVHNVCFNRSSSDIVTGDFYRTLAINEWWDNGYEPIWTTANSQGLKSGGYLFPGSNATVGGKTATRSILETRQTPKEESDWEKRIDDVMKWFTDDDFDFIALYFEEPDSDGHNRGPQSDYIKDVSLPLLDRTIKYLLTKAAEVGLQDNLNIIITSDHGMARINTSVRFDDAISTLRYVDPSDILFQYPYGPLGMVEPYPDKLTTVYELLKDAHSHLQVFYKKDLPERFHYSNNDRISSIVLLADQGHAIYRMFPGIHVVRGQHGYDNQLTDMRASFYAIGPSFKKGYTIPGFETIHVYELMCHLLGLTPAPNNGSLDVLLPSLRDTETPVSSTIKNWESTTSGVASHFIAVGNGFLWSLGTFLLISILRFC